MSDQLEREHDLSEAFDRAHERIAQDEKRADEARSDPTFMDSLAGMVSSVTKASTTSYQLGYEAGHHDGYLAGLRKASEMIAAQPRKVQAE
jgi:hypothetical protein